MPVETRYTPPKMGWFEATRRFLLNNGEKANFGKIMTAFAVFLRTVGVSLSAVSVVDDFVGFVFDDLLWLYGAYAVFRIIQIRWTANHHKVASYQ